MVITLSDLRDMVRTLGDYENAPRITDDYLTDCINKALAELYDLITGAFEGDFATIASIATIADTQTVELPTDFYELRALDRDCGDDRFVPLRRLTFPETYRLGGQGQPVGYMLHRPSSSDGSIGTVRLFPVPDNVYTLRIVYDPLPVTLAEDNDSFDFRNGWEELLVHRALLRVDEREERPTGERMQTIAILEQRVKKSAERRNSAEPEYLDAHMRGRAIDDDMPWSW